LPLLQLQTKAILIYHRRAVSKYFIAITGSEEVSWQAHPDVYLKSAAKLNLDPSLSVAFEDTPSGIRSAHSAGMQVVGVATTHSPEELVGFPLLAIIENYEIPNPLSFINGRIS
jgi:beta-phosphoglucomutase-like phosphatase (HAD superfamily)